MRGALLAGAACLTFGSIQALAQGPAPDSPAKAAAAAVVPGVPYVTRVVVDGGDSAVETIATETSSLKSLEKDPPPGPPGLVGRAKLDIERITAAMMATGRYGAAVDVTAAGVSVGSPSAPDVVQRAPRPVPMVIRIQPGPVFTIGRVQILAADRGPHRPSAIRPEEVGLKTGEPAPSGVVFAAEAKIVDRLRAEGFPFARVANREAVADHARKQLDVTINVASGLRAPFGEVVVRGTREVDPKVVRGRVPFDPGDRYDPKKMIELRDELAKLDVFSSIRVKEGDGPDAQGRVPVYIDVEEKKFRYVGAAAKYGTVEGASLNAYWGHRNLFGGAEKLRIEATSSRLISNDPQNYEYSLKTSFEKPGIWTGFDDLLVEVEAMRERPDAYWRDGARAAVAVRRRISSEFSAQVGLEVEGSSIRDTFGEREFVLVGAPLSATFDNTNSKLDPTEGVRATLIAAPYFNSGKGASSINIFKGQVATYWGFDDAGRYVLAGRLGAGAMLGPTATDEVPANRRFFAGGGGSIRGFAYQNASPKCDSRAPRPKNALRCDDDQPIGGRSLLEASAEMRIKVTDTIGIVPFVDAGAAFDKAYPDFGEDIRVGAGIGLRYYTAIGPIRFDVATPVVGKDKNDPTVAFYVSVGQAF